MLEQVEQRRLGPVKVVDHDHERLRSATRLEQLPEGPRENLVRRAALGFAEQAEQRRAAIVPSPSSSAAVGVVAEQLLEDLDDRPVRDPLPVGEAAALDDARSSSRGRGTLTGGAISRPRPGRPGWRARQARSAIRSLRAPAQLTRALAPADEGATARRAAAPRPETAMSRGPASARLALERERLDRLRPRPVRTSRTCLPPSRISPGGAACSSRAATSTASPVARRSAAAGDDLARVDADSHYERRPVVTSAPR